MIDHKDGDGLEANRSTEKAEASVFSKEQEKALRKEGYGFFILTGKSMKDFVREGRAIKGYKEWGIERDLPVLAAYPSMISEVAINLKRLYLPKSNSHNLKDQNEMVHKFSEEYLSRIIPGVRAIIGQIPDYLEIAFQRLDATEGKEHLFTREDDGGYARANVPFPPMANPGGHVGFSTLSKTFFVELKDSEYNIFPNLWACPIVVPVSLRLDKSPYEAYEAHFGKDIAYGRSGITSDKL